MERNQEINRRLEHESEGRTKKMKMKEGTGSGTKISRDNDEMLISGTKTFSRLSGTTPRSSLGRKFCMLANKCVVNVGRIECCHVQVYGVKKFKNLKTSF